VSIALIERCMILKTTVQQRRSNLEALAALGSRFTADVRAPHPSRSSWNVRPAHARRSSRPTHRDGNRRRILAIRRVSARFEFPRLSMARRRYSLPSSGLAARSSISNLQAQNHDWGVGASKAGLVPDQTNDSASGVAPALSREVPAAASRRVHGLTDVRDPYRPALPRFDRQPRFEARVRDPEPRSSPRSASS